MAAYSDNQAMINAIKHANMKNGEIIIKLNGELITGKITAIKMDMREACYTSFVVEGMIRD